MNRPSRMIVAILVLVGAFAVLPVAAEMQRQAAGGLPRYPVAWKLIPGQLAVDIGSSTSETWIIGSNPVPGGNEILTLACNPFYSTQNSWGRVDGAGTRITVGRYTWVCNASGQIFRRAGGSGSWKPMPGGATDLGAGGTQVWAIGTNRVPGGYGIFHWNESAFKWEPVPGAGVRIAAGGDDQPWVINDSGDIFRWENDRWVPIAGKASDITVLGGTGPGAAWVTGIDSVPGGHSIYRWNGTAFELATGAAVSLASQNYANIYAVTSSGQVYAATGLRSQ
jgi:hypothetical protein